MLSYFIYFNFLKWGLSDLNLKQLSTPLTKVLTVLVMVNPTCVVRHFSSIGWRNYMEDASISIPSFSKQEFGLFGVFDGHGGAEVAKFVEKHFPE